MTATAAPTSSGLAPARLWALLRARWPAMAAIVLGTTALVFFYSAFVLTKDPVFRAGTTLDIAPTGVELDVANNFARNSALQTAGVLTQTYAEYVRSRPVIESVADEILAEKVLPRADEQGGGLGLRRLWNELNYGRAPRQNRRDAFIEALAESTTVGTVAGTFLLRIEVAWDDPRLAARFANELAERLMVEAAVKTSGPANQFTQALAQRLGQSRATLNAKQAQAAQMRSSLGVADLPRQMQAVVEERLAEEARLTNDLAQVSSSSTQVGVLQGQANGKLSATLPAVEQALVLERPKAAGLRQSVRQRSARIGQLNGQLNRLSRAQATLAMLDRDIEMLQLETTALAERFSTAQLNTLAGAPAIRIVERALPPLVRESPRVMVNTALGFIAGSALAGMFLLLAPAPVAVRRTRTRAVASDLGGRVYPGVLRRPRAGGSFTAAESREIKTRLADWLSEPLLHPSRPLYVLGASQDSDATILANLLRAFLQSRGERVATVSGVGDQLPAIPNAGEGGDSVRPLVYCGGLLQTGRIPRPEGGEDLILVIRKGSDSGDYLDGLRRELDASGWREPYVILIEP